MFHNASIRLTIWYTAIIMAICLAFSAWVYHEAMQEVGASLSGPLVVRFQDKFGPVTRLELQHAIDSQYNDSRGRIIGNLLMLNFAVLAAGAAGSYFLARRTMRPIEDALIAQNRFTADASHELRTPLAAMKTEIEVYLRDPKVTTDDLRELLGSNLEEIDRMSGLAEGLLTLARSDEPVHLGAVQAADVVQEACVRMQPLAKAKKIRIKTDVTPVKLMAESSGLASIVGILLDNAIKYSPEKSEITVAVTRQDGHGLITVTDQGPGIAPADLPHIFERFYRSDTSRTKNAAHGHGLGLSIAKKLATHLRSTITVRSEQGKGTTFTLRVPTAQ